MVARRLLTVSAFILLTLLSSLLSPLLLLLAWLIGRLPGCRGAVPTLGLILGYLWCETIGIVAATWLWPRPYTGMLRAHHARTFEQFRNNFAAGSKVLYAHLGGVPAINAYSYVYRNG